MTSKRLPRKLKKRYKKLGIKFLREPSKAKLRKWAQDNIDWLIKQNDLLPYKEAKERMKARFFIPAYPYIASMFDNYGSLIESFPKSPLNG